MLLVYVASACLISEKEILMSGKKEIHRQIDGETGVLGLPALGDCRCTGFRDYTGQRGGGSCSVWGRLKNKKWSRSAIPHHHDGNQAMTFPATGKMYCIRASPAGLNAQPPDRLPQRKKKSGGTRQHGTAGRLTTKHPASLTLTPRRLEVPDSANRLQTGPL